MLVWGVMVLVGITMIGRHPLVHHHLLPFTEAEAVADEGVEGTTRIVEGEEGDLIEEGQTGIEMILDMIGFRREQHLPIDLLRIAAIRVVDMKMAKLCTQSVQRLIDRPHHLEVKDG